MRALARYEHGDFAGALSIATTALTRTPNVLMLRQLQAASHLYAGEYQAGIDVVKPLLGGSGTQTAIYRATLQLNMAFGLAMTNIGANAEQPDLQEAARLSGEALDAYPCLLEFRCTRASVLALTGHAEEALQILEYVHFDTATRRQRAQRQTARAVALRSLGRQREADEAAALAVRLDGASLKILHSLGFSPDPRAKVIETRPTAGPAVVAFDEELEPLSAGASVLARVAGAVLLVFGLAVGSLGGIAVFRQFESPARADWTAALFSTFLAVLSIFCLVVSYRLALNRPNRYGSILPPTAWASLAGLFGAGGLGFAATTFTSKMPTRGALLGGMSALMFAVLCWRKRQAMVNRSA